MKAYINIGSNIGDRAAHISRAVGMISACSGARVTVSRPVESRAWGYESANMFMNIGLMFDTALSPYKLLEILLGVERSICDASHRGPDGSYCDRVIDIDLIAVDDMVIDTVTLVLPHPRMHMREFVLRPMAELAPGWRHPVSGLTAAEMISRLEQSHRPM